MSEEQSRKTRRHDDKQKPVVVSVRFPELLLQQVQAYAAIADTTANAFIREAVAAHLRNLVHTAEFQAASEAHLRRAQAAVAAVMRVDDIDYALDHDPSEPEGGVVDGSRSRVA